MYTYNFINTLRYYRV